MKFIEAGGHQKQTLMEVTTIRKDLEKAGPLHSKKCKCKEESKERDGKWGSEKGNNKNGEGKNENKSQGKETKAKVATAKANVGSLVIIITG